MEKLMNWSKNHPVWVAVLLLIPSVRSLFFIGNIRFDTSTESMMMAGDPKKGYYQDTIEKFGSDCIVVVFVQDQDLFTPPALSRLRQLSLDLSKIDGIYKTESLFTVSNIKGTDGVIDSNPLMDAAPETQQEADRVKANALSSPILKNNLISPEGDATALNLYLEPVDDPDFYPILAVNIEEVLNRYNQNFDILFQIGTPDTNRTITDMLLADQRTCVPLGVVVVFLMLMVTMRSASGAILPLLTSGFSILITGGFMGFMDIPLNLLTSVIPTLIIVVGATEDVHLLSEYMDGLHQTKGARQKAVSYMAAKVGTAVLLTSLTTCIGFFSITINKIIMLKQFGIASGFGLLVNPLVTVTLIPVYLRFFGPKTIRRQKAGKHVLDRILDVVKGHIIHLVQNRRGATMAVVGLITVVIGGFIPQIRVDNDVIGFFKPDSDIVLRTNRLTDALSGGQSFFLRVSSDVPGVFKTAEGLRELDNIQNYLNTSGSFDKTIALTDYIRLIHKEMNNGDLAFDTIPANPETPAP